MWKAFTTLMTGVLLAACVGLHELSNEVSTFSQWPAELKPGSYVFERLPSQQMRPESQKRLENAARHAIEGAGFTPAADPKLADFTIQVGARVSANERPLYDDPFWWHGGVFHSHHGGPSFWHPGFIWMASSPSYEREVALLIRDRRTGEPLFEARATNDGGSPSIGALLQAMFDATMIDFPHGGIHPRRVVTRIEP